jgi:hypothetical protein
MVLPYSVFLVLGAAAPARAGAHTSYLRISEYSSPALLRGPWRQALALDFTRLGHTSLLGLEPSLFSILCAC